jgi:hypothetical protein
MSKSKFVICTRNTGYEVSLELRKLYLVIPDTEAISHDQIRVVDESGEDYLYPSSFFVPIDLPASVAKLFVHAA